MSVYKIGIIVVVVVIIIIIKKHKTPSGDVYHWATRRSRQKMNHSMLEYKTRCCGMSFKANHDTDITSIPARSASGSGVHV